MWFPGIRWAGRTAAQLLLRCVPHRRRGTPEDTHHRANTGFSHMLFFFGSVHIPVWLDCFL